MIEKNHSRSDKSGFRRFGGLCGDPAGAFGRGSRGAALLVVLFIVMVITIASLSFLKDSDVELACGSNMELRTDMDYTVESGLEHARGLIISPQEVSSEYWGGDVTQQIAPGEDYYDVTVSRDDSDPTDRCTYIIDCSSYRLRAGERVGGSAVRAELRLDPCIAYWVGSDARMSRRITVNGDVYCTGNVDTAGVINGDVFSRGTVSGTGIEGRCYEGVGAAPVGWPGIGVGDYSPTYYLGTSIYGATEVAGPVHPAGTFNPSAGNPGGVRFYRGVLELPGGVDIRGSVVVDGDLRVNGSNVITAVKNFPAVVVSGDLIVEPGGQLEVNGLAVVQQWAYVSSEGGKLEVTGGLFTANGVAELAIDSSGNSNHAVLYGDPSWGPSDGQSGGALEFDGVDDYAQTADSSTALQLTGDYTLSVWIKPEAAQNPWAGILSKCDPQGSINHWTLQLSSRSPQHFIVHHPDDLSPSSWDTGIQLSDVTGAWHHIAVVRRGNLMTSYLDGQVCATGSWDVGPGGGNGHLNIGAERTAAQRYLYKGLIDEIRIYNNALDPNDIYPPVDGLPGLLVHWRLDGAGADIDITAAPCKTALMVWSAEGTAVKWEQVGGAFYKSIRRR